MVGCRWEKKIVLTGSLPNRTSPENASFSPGSKQLVRVWPSLLAVFPQGRLPLCEAAWPVEGNWVFPNPDNQKAVPLPVGFQLSLSPDRPCHLLESV